MTQTTNNVDVDNALKSPYDVETLVQSNNEHRQVIVDVGQTQIPVYDHRTFTYVAAGNGAGEVETITYKTGGASGTAVCVETFTYDASNRVSTIATVVS